MPGMKSPPGQLSLFEVDARGEPQVEQTEAALPRPPAATRLANHDESPGPSVGNSGDPLALLAGYLTQLVAAPPPEAAHVPSEADLRRARDDWLRRLQTSRRSKSTLIAYRVAIDGLL